MMPRNSHVAQVNSALNELYSSDVKGSIYKLVLKDVELEIIHWALNRFGTITKSASVLGISRKTITRKLHAAGFYPNED